MKSIYSLLFLFISSITFSQNKIISDTVESLDSIYFYEYHSNEYKLTSKYFVLEKIESGKTLNAIQFIYDSVQNIWFNHYSDTIKYFDDEEISEEIRKYWDIDNNEWIDCEYTKWSETGKIEDTYKITRIYGIPAATSGKRETNEYDNNGNLIKTITKYCGNDLVWNLGEVRDYEYDEYNRLITYVFDSITKWEYLYDENNLNNEIFISLINVNQEWDTTWHHILTYSNDTLIEDLTHKFITNIEFSRDTFRYDNNENIALRYYELWDTINNNWHTDIIVKHQYNSNDQIIEYANINSYSGNWEFVRYLYEYDLPGNLMEYKRQSGDSTNIIDEWRYQYTYTENNNLLEEEYQVFDENNNIWLNKSKQNNFWSILTNVTDNVLQQNRFRIYPNPCTDNIQIKNNQSIPFTIDIYDITGKQLLSELLESDNNIIDFRNYRTGSYILLFKNKYGAEKQIIIKK